MLKLNSFSKTLKFSGTLHHKDILLLFLKMITVCPNKHNEVLDIKTASHKIIFINYIILIEFQNE